MADQQKTGETPRYRLTECAYIDDVMYEAGREIEFEGVPGYHMEAINNTARQMKQKHPSNYIDPILEMTEVSAKAQSQIDPSLVQTITAAVMAGLNQQKS